MKRYLWVVKDGRKINQWDDPWLLEMPNRKLSYIPMEEIKNLKVHDVIDPISNSENGGN